jgi:hypothetical protein
MTQIKENEENNNKQLERKENNTNKHTSFDS